MKKGMMTIKSTGAEMQGFFIDREALEFARFNLRTKKRIEARHNAKAAKARFKMEMERMANRVLIDIVLGGTAALAGNAGFIHPVIWTPVALICLCAACVRLGMWFSRAVNK